MKLIKLIPLLVFVVTIGAQAQTSGSSKNTTATKSQASTTKTVAITDEDLIKYAKTMDSVKVMQETLTQIITETVQQNTVMTVARYNELFKMASDKTKLAAANATPEETAFLEEVAALREMNTGRINSAYQALAKDYVGLKTFNMIKKSMETDPNLKTRYETISQDVASQRGATATTGTDSEG